MIMCKVYSGYTSACTIVMCKLLEYSFTHSTTGDRLIIQVLDRMEYCYDIRSPYWKRQL